ncbi:hypothetical protein FFLO_04601 [Filobasidium floriforme]|uniref:Glycosyltransferase 61 catalytic domain-containing protein n=1 Tax=Filobasidium floriforme TaxID=5210 RepID=A0A8K0JJ53_9TREE|nr:hypothetical protein FFLO_04601 [Filobasidium floriforme]
MPMLINRSTLGPKRAALAGALCLLLVLFLWSRSDGSPPRLPLSSDRLISVASFPTSKLVRRIDGYNVLENVLAHDDKSYIITDDLSTINSNLIISQPGDRKHSQLKILSRAQADNLLRGTCRTYPEACEEVGDDLELRVQHLSGISLYLADEPDAPTSSSGLEGYHHYAAELIFAGYRAGMSSLTRSEADAVIMGKQEDISRVIFPGRDLGGGGGGWGDEAGLGSNLKLNEMIVRHGLACDVVEQEHWQQFTAREAPWVLLEKVVIVDRKAATQNHSSDPFLWNQPALSALQTPVGATNPAAFFARPRTRLIRHLLQGPDMHIPTLRKKRNKSFNGKQVKIVYFSQQGSNRRLVNEDHEFLVELLESLEKQSRGRFGQKVSVEVVDPEVVSAEDQVRSVLDADIVLGIHDSPLTHTLWMSPGGVVIEIFPPNAFLRDYQIIAEALGHRHVAVWNDRQYKAEEWMKHEGELRREALNDGAVIPVRVASTITAIQTHDLKILQLAFAAGSWIYSPGSTDSYYEDVARSHLMCANVAMYEEHPEM